MCMGAVVVCPGGGGRGRQARIWLPQGRRGRRRPQRAGPRWARGAAKGRRSVERRTVARRVEGRRRAGRRCLRRGAGAQYVVHARVFGTARLRPVVRDLLIEDVGGLVLVIPIHVQLRAIGRGSLRDHRGRRIALALLDHRRRSSDQSRVIARVRRRRERHLHRACEAGERRTPGRRQRPRRRGRGAHRRRRRQRRRAGGRTLRRRRGRCGRRLGRLRRYRCRHWGGRRRCRCRNSHERALHLGTRRDVSRGGGGEARGGSWRWRRSGRHARRALLAEALENIEVRTAVLVV